MTTQSQSISIIGSANQHRSPNLDAEVSINLYPEIVDGGNPKAPVVLIGTPGTIVWADFASFGVTGACRGTAYAGNKLFVCFGTGVYRVDVNQFTNVKTPVLIQSISAGNSRVKFATDGFHLLFVDGSSMWAVDLATYTVETVVIDAFAFPKDIVYMYSRFFCINNDPTNGTTNPVSGVQQNQNKVFWSDVGVTGYLSWGGLNYESASLTSSPITAIRLRHGELWLMKSDGYEVWSFTGVYEAPLARVQGSPSSVGCLAADAAVDIADNIYWIGSAATGKNQVFMTSSGYGAQRISTHAIEYAMDEANSQGLSTTDFVGFAYQMEGHLFYVITSRNMNQTFVYDVLTGIWHRRSTRNTTSNTDGYWLPMFAIYAYDTVLVANDSKPMLLQLDLDAYMDYVDPVTNIGTAPLIRIRRTTPIWFDLKPFMIREVVVDLETGVGLTLGQGSSPMMNIRVSLDSGHSWGNYRAVDIGKIGNYSARARSRGMGMAHSGCAVFEFSISDPVRVVIIDAMLYFEVSRNR